MEIETFLHDLANQAVPGGAAAAAQAAAMGAALLSKVARVALQRSTLSASATEQFQTLGATASEQLAVLTALSDEDTRAYRKLLRLQHSPADRAATEQAWSRVIDIPIRLAETCRLLLDTAKTIDPICPPHLLPDLWIAQSLLTAGEHAGVWCAEANLRIGPSTLDTASFNSRLQALGIASSGDQ